MLKLENISIELKNINKSVESYQIAELIQKIDAEVREQTAATKPSEKNRPLFATWSPLKDGRVAFTNSYSMFILNKNILPFNVSFMSEYSPEEQKTFINENNIPKNTIVSGCFPNIYNCIPDEMEQNDTLKLNIESFNAWYKVQDKKELKNKNVLYNMADDLDPYTVDATLLKELIDILQLTGTVPVEYYGPLKPCIIRTESGKNIGLLLPVKKY